MARGTDLSGVSFSSHNVGGDVGSELTKEGHEEVHQHDWAWFIGLGLLVENGSRAEEENDQNKEGHGLKTNSANGRVVNNLKCNDLSSYYNGASDHRESDTYIGSAVVTDKGNAVVKQQISIVNNQITTWVNITEDGTAEKLEAIESNVPNKPSSTLFAR